MARYDRHIIISFPYCNLFSIIIITITVIIIVKLRCISVRYWKTRALALNFLLGKKKKKKKLRSCFTWVLRMKLTQKREVYMANGSPNARVPKATYIPPACVASLGLHVWSARLFRYQHVGIGNAKVLRDYPTRGPNTRGFALQWNIG